MQSLAIQTALDNLVETVRTSLMAEFLELLRDGKPAAIVKRKRKSPAKKKGAKARRSGKSKRKTAS